jgi:hypothetical protein
MKNLKTEARNFQIRILIKIHTTLSLCFNQHHILKMYGGYVKFCTFLTLALDSVKWSVSCHGRFTPNLGKRSPIPTGKEDRMGTGLDDMEKRNNFSCAKN